MTHVLGDLDPPRARLLLEMAEAALRDPPGAVVLPDGWDVLQSFRSDGGALPHGRGFYAAGSPGGPGTERVAVLALGLPWAEYLDWSQNPGGEARLAALPAGAVAADAPAEARFDAWLGGAYGLLRNPVWTHLPLALREGGGRLWITGMNLGGPLAHLAALDLRPAKQPPSVPVLTSTFPCWTFSSPPAGNAALKTFADSKGGAVVNVWAGKETAVDLYPTAPDATQGFSLPGTVERVATPIPRIDDPWTERGGPFYLKMLGGTPEGLPSPARIVNPPAGFDRTRAHALSGICMTAYRRRLRPGDIDPTVTDLTSGGVRWGVLIVTGAEAVVAFRGTVTADEMARITADAEVAAARFLDPSGARVHGGALRLYTAPITTPTSSPFRAELVRLLKEKAAGKPVYLCGHDVGGALAALAALDLRVTAPEVQVAKVYGFGATPVGDFRFAGLYRTKLENDSYLLMRDVDFARRLRLVGAYEPIPPILVQGAPADDDASRHSLASYVALLDPSGRQPAQVLGAASIRAPEHVEATLTERESAWLDERMSALGIARHKHAPRSLAAGPEGRIVLSPDGDSALAPHAPGDGGAPVFAVDALRVEAGDTLVVRAPEGDAPMLVAGRLALGENAQVVMQAGGALHVATAEIGEGAMFRLVGRDGAPGLSFTGMHGLSGRPGEDGEPGGGSLYLGRVTGSVTVVAGGGNGGSGGDGTDGDRGSGGDGGRGGDGGAGGTVVVDVVLEPGGCIQFHPLTSHGGAGGRGGAVGHAAGSPFPPKKGEKGADGREGDLPVFVVRRHD